MPCIECGRPSKGATRCPEHERTYRDTQPHDNRPRTSTDHASTSDSPVVRSAAGDDGWTCADEVLWLRLAVELQARRITQLETEAQRGAISYGITAEAEW